LEFVLCDVDFFDGEAELANPRILPKCAINVEDTSTPITKDRLPSSNVPKTLQTIHTDFDNIGISLNLIDIHALRYDL